MYLQKSNGKTDFIILTHTKKKNHISLNFQLFVYYFVSMKYLFEATTHKKLYLYTYVKNKEFY